MCGIAGFLGAFEAETLSAMSAAIAHRGPDGEGSYVHAGSGLGLAHRRLAIIDLSEAGSQPMWDATGTVVITFNGEIYNYRELKRELESDGYRFNSNCDTEVILNLYLRDGPACLPKLNGIFAFGLWDTRSQELLLARDGLGVKPLYCARTPQGLLFASELKALLRAPEVDKALDYEAISCYLTFLYAPSPHTMLKGVSKLLPGQAFLAGREGVRKSWRFYELPYDQPLERISVEEAAAQTRFYIEQAVRRQLVADVPVGAFLSGGLDSSAIAAFASQGLEGRKFSCFTIGFKDSLKAAEGFSEDLPYAQKVAAQLGLDLKTVYVDSAMEGDFEKMVYQLDEPQADPAALNTFYISRLARENGIKVLLSGAGGDDIFTGYRRHMALELEKYWNWLPGQAWSALSHLGGLMPPGIAWGRRIAKAFRYAHLSGDARTIGYFQWMAPEVVQGLFSRGSRETLAGFEASSLMHRALDALPAGTPPLNRMLYLDAKFFLADHNLNYTDKMSMAAGVEVRVPFLDRDLVSFAARLPLRYKQRGAVGKWIFRKAMEPVLPAEVIHRPKTGFGVPLRSWMRGKFGQLTGDYLSETSLKKRGLFNAGAVRSLVEQDRAGKMDAAYTILALACVEIWLRRFAD